MRLTFAIVTIVAVLSPRAEAQPTQAPPQSAEIAIVANAEAGTVALVESPRARSWASSTSIPRVPSALGPGATNYAQDTDVSPDGRTLYVSRGYLGDVAAFDIASGRLLWQRSLDTGRADHMTITPDGRSLFVSAIMDNRVYRSCHRDGRDRRSSGDRRLSARQQGLEGWPAAVQHAALACSPPSPVGQCSTTAETPGDPVQLTIADAETLAVRERIPLENAFRPWQFSPDEKSVYAQRSNEHAVVAYDLASRKVVRRLELPVKPGVTAADWDFEAPHHGLALTEDGETLCLAGRASDYAALVRAPDLTLIATIPVGDAPGWAETADSGRICLDRQHPQRRPLDHLDPESLGDRAPADGERPEAHHRGAHACNGHHGGQGTIGSTQCVAASGC